MTIVRLPFRLLSGALAAAGLAAALAACAVPAGGVRFEITYPASLDAGPLHGRMLLVVSSTNDRWAGSASSIERFRQRNR